MLHRHFNRKSTTYLSMKHLQRPHFDPVLRHTNMTRAVVSHEDNVLRKVQRIILCERSTHAQQVKNLHRNHVLHFVLAGHRNASAREHRSSKNKGTRRVLICGHSTSLIEIGDHIQIIPLDELVQSHSGTCRPPEFKSRTLLCNFKEVGECV